MLKIPALIDPHVHFRFPGDTHKEDWQSAAYACIQGGIVSVCDMPNNKPPTVTYQRLLQKKAEIGRILQSAGLPLDFHLYLGAHQDHLYEIDLVKKEACGIKVFMGSSTGGLLIDRDCDLELIFQKASRHDMLVAVHAEDEAYLKARQKLGAIAKDHSIIREPKAAAIAIEKALFFAAKYKVRLYILHVSSAEELVLIKKAKALGLAVFAEATPHHLFLSTKDYESLGNFAVVNPPLRSLYDQNCLWEALLEGTIDTIGTDHAPHTIEEKKLPYGQCPSGVPGIDALLPLLLTAVNQKRLTLSKVIELTHENPKKIFRLKDRNAYVNIDMGIRKKLQVCDLYTKCRWSPFLGKELVGWPISTVIEGITFNRTIKGEEELHAKDLDDELLRASLFP